MADPGIRTPNLPLSEAPAHDVLAHVDVGGGVLAVRRQTLEIFVQRLLGLAGLDPSVVVDLSGRITKEIADRAAADSALSDRINAILAGAPDDLNTFLEVSARFAISAPAPNTLRYIDPAPYDLSRYVSVEQDKNGRIFRAVGPALPVVANTLPWDQRFVAFRNDHQDGTGRTAIYSQDLATGKVTQISYHGDNEHSPRLTSDGYVTWISERPGAVVGAGIALGPAPGGAYCSPVDAPDERPVLPLRAIAFRGDNIAVGGVAAALQARLPGFPVFDFSSAVITALGMAARQGGRAARYHPVTGTIPASGSVDLTGPSKRAMDLAGPNDSFGQAAGSIHGILNGIAGTLAWTGTKATFTRDAAGSAIGQLTDEPFIADPVTTTPDATSVPQHREMVQVFWIGSDTFYAGRELVALVRAMAEAMRTRGKRFVVASLLNSSQQPIGSAAYASLSETNALLQASFPTAYCDVRAYLLTKGDGSTNDNADVAAGVIPRSLRQSGDVRALNVTGVGHAATALANFLLAKGWF